MPKRPRCPVCNSKRWHRDGLSGSIVCEEGHLMQGYVQETTETQEGPSQHTQTTRRMRKGRTKKEKPPSNDHFHGDRSKFLVWQCMQLILREQLRVLIDEMGWPVELEAVTRDLWTMLVASSRVPAAPVDYEKGEEPAGSYSGPRSGDRYTRAGRKPYGRRGAKKLAKKELDEYDDDAGDDAEDGGGATTDAEGADEDEEESDADSYFSEGQDADDERSRPGAASRPNSPFSRQLSPHAAITDSQVPPARYPQHQRQRLTPKQPKSDDPRDHPRMEYTLLVIYLACITLRLPVFLADLFRLAETYQILYLDAVIHLPANMQAHLLRENRDVLFPSSVPHLYSHNPSLDQLREDTAQIWLARLVDMYREDWSIEFPEANVPLMLGRLCEVLALPPLAYSLAFNLIGQLPASASFYLTDAIILPASTSPARKMAWPVRLIDKGLAQDWRTVLPEIKLATVLILLCRMLWALDGEKDGAKAPVLSAFASKLPPCDDWITAIERIATLERPGDLSRLWSQEVADLQPADLDAYLGFIETKIVSEEKVPSRMPEISRFFPPQDASDSSARPPPTPESYLSQLASITSSLYRNYPSAGTEDESSGPAILASILPDKASHHPPQALAASLPPALHRLLAVVADHLTPLPSAFPPHLRGAAPNNAFDGILNLLPFVTQLEQVLLQGGSSPKAAKEVFNDQRANAAEERHRRKAAETERRKELDRILKERQAARRLRKSKVTVDSENDDMVIDGEQRVKSKEWISDSDEEADDGDDCRGSSGGRAARGGASEEDEEEADDS
ncbi:RNA polymerase I specific transcription initiation factor Rrn7 [Rhodotorula toruloides]|uniref:RNA polymerase I specific transcription initiation factor Rrn7 n=1 Tax=Rhodotorula toruloides TaxID=5286 RepID=A0A511KIR4_RHOTO|nr:RNA polymerase I specific transcription initiation factor Rrn7 [Rhodotorula toruloides]